MDKPKHYRQSSIQGNLALRVVDLLCLIWLGLAWLCFVLLSFALLWLVVPCSASPCFALLCLALLCFALLCYVLLGFCPRTNMFFKHGLPWASLLHFQNLCFVFYVCSVISRNLGCRFQKSWCSSLEITGAFSRNSWSVSRDVWAVSRNYGSPFFWGVSLLNVPKLPISRNCGAFSRN